jgi:hypothetical protein
MLDDHTARFTLACERGHFELDATLDAGGKLGGFVGRSPGATPPASYAKMFDAAVALYLGTWSTAAYRKVFSKQQVPEPRAKTVTADLHAEFGTCKPAGFTHEGLGWTLDLKCSRGGPLQLSIELDDHGDIAQILFHPPSGVEPKRCPLHE